jgi:hypothetical protein
MAMADSEPQTRLSCGCVVLTKRDFLGRVLGTIQTKGEACARADHAPGGQVIMPGRENAAGGA